MSGVAILVLGPSGLATARRAAAALAGARIHGLRGRVDGAEIGFDDVAAHLRALFAEGTAIVGVCAAGILIRALAPALSDKRAEPPVIAIADDGSAVVPLLGGHRGANDIARTLGAAFAVAPAITTAGDVRFGVALDAPPPGWILANPEHLKPFMAAMLAGKTVRIEGEAPFLAAAGIPSDPAGALRITATADAVSGDDAHLVYLHRPAVHAIGVGCERGVAADDLSKLVRRVVREAGIEVATVAGVFSLDLKADEPAIAALGEEFAVPVRFFDAATLEAETPRLANPSQAVFREVGCHGVAEAAALAAAGPRAELIAAKRKSARATCAIARAPTAIAAATVGRRRGWLGIVGTGPGSEDWLTPEAATMLARAEDAVGYRLYLDLVGARLAGKTRHDFELGEEEARVRTALDLAAAGRRVALVSSGDPGIYAMAALVFELVDGAGRADWRRLEIEIAPGISALQAAAARVGAPLGHDFCAVSLSDLLTPWATIERRIEAAAEADFVVAFYNPASHRRARQIERARDILARHRPQSTPVVIARKLGRQGESVRVTTLGALSADDADMETLVLVGSSATRTVRRGDGGAWIYTPRGYDTAAAGEETSGEKTGGEKTGERSA